MAITTQAKVIEIDGIHNVTAFTGRVERRLKAYLAATPHVAAERSRLLTESWKETEGELLHIRRGKAFKRVMDELPVIIRDGELLVGSQTKYLRGASPAVEWDPEITLDLFEGNGPKLSGLVVGADVTEEEQKNLLEDAGYWKDRVFLKEETRIRHQVFGDRIDDLQKSRVIIGPVTRPTTSKIGDYAKVLTIGLNGIIAEAKRRLREITYYGRNDIEKHSLLTGMIIACEGVINFARRYAEFAREMSESEKDPIRKKELERIASICEWVPANPARDFREAVQSFWLTHLSINLEAGFDAEAPGRMDQYLYPFYAKDLEDNRLSRQEAAELLGCLWVKFTEMEGAKGRLWKSNGQTNQAQCITIGGVTGDGKDATNELTYLLLEVVRQVRVPQPPIYLRCHKGTPEELWQTAVEVTVERGDGNPAFLNDAAVLLNFAGLGIPIAVARDWAGGGCIHPHVCHASTGDMGQTINLAKIFELTLNNGVDPVTGKQLGLTTGDPRSFASFDELYAAFKEQVSHVLILMTQHLHMCWQLRNRYYSLPFFSALIDDCMEKGIDYMAGGCRYPQLYFGNYDRGHQNVADSLAAIKKLVYEEHRVGMDELLEALKVNFVGKETLRRALQAAPKYGNDDDYVDDIFDDLSLWMQRRIAQEKHPLGSNQRIHRGGATQHYYLGLTVGALPDGRKAFEPLADGTLSPMRGADVKGPTAVINSASKVNHNEIATSSLFNMKITRSIVRSRDGQRKLASLIKTYFNRGGYHIQFNLMGQEMLLEAKKHREKYRDLLVRVAGYSAYFVELSPEVQDEIIARCEHEL